MPSAVSEQASNPGLPKGGMRRVQRAVRAGQQHTGICGKEQGAGQGEESLSSSLQAVEDFT